MKFLQSINPRCILRAAKKVGTPFYYYSADIVRSRYKKLKSALPANWRLYFAVKANPNVAVLEIYRELGAKAETASAGEMLACFKAGFDAGDMALSGPVKTEAELAILKKSRPGVIHTESKEELAALNEIGVPLNVALRINQDLRLRKSGGAKIMVGGNEKFGFSPGEAVTILRKRSDYHHLNFRGFHIYFGTQIRSARTWLKGASGFLEWIAWVSDKIGFTPGYVNFGGGLGIAYREGESEFNLEILKTGLKKLTARYDKRGVFKSTGFFIEPGRYLSGPAGVYVMKITGIKRIRNRNYALTDGGIHHALFPFRVSREFPVKLINRISKGKRIRYILGGPLCTTLDQSDLPVSLPQLKTGDLLGIYQSGSYGYSTSMHYFLSHPLPAELLADGDRLTLVRKASTSRHLFVNQVKRRIW